MPESNVNGMTNQEREDRIAALGFSLQAHICEETTEVTIERAAAFLKFIQGNQRNATN